jgi:tRNA modification GTPase
MTYGWIQDDAEVIDEVQVCYYSPPHTYTGEHLVEFFVHGSPAVLRRMVHLLVRCGARPAEPGEFTLRAFRSGRIDLARAEAVNDLVRAENEQSRRLAIRALRGGLVDVLSEIRRRLEAILVSVETELEFESEDTGADAAQALRQELRPCIARAAQLVQAGRRQQMRPRGIVTAIVGKPNVGKSSLLNAILHRQRAIVSAVPGTTRDTLEESVDIDGVPFLLVDTAGVFGAAAEPDALAVQRTGEAISTAELVIFLLDLSVDLDETDHAIKRRLQRKPPEAGVICLANKSDLIPAADLPARLATFQQAVPHPDIFPISAKFGTNVDRLLSVLRTSVNAIGLSASADDILINTRQLYVMSKLLSALESAQAACTTGVTLDVIAADLYQAVRFAYIVQGEEFDGNVLDAVFSQFCIGK